MSHRSKPSNLIEASHDLRMALRCIRELAKQEGLERPSGKQLGIGRMRLTSAGAKNSAKWGMCRL